MIPEFFRRNLRLCKRLQDFEKFSYFFHSSLAGLNYKPLHDWLDCVHLSSKAMRRAAARSITPATVTTQSRFEIAIR
jgi:hypothetical protein